MTLTFDIFILKFVHLVTRVQDYISTKIEFSTTLRLWVDRRHGTDGRTRCDS